MPSDQPSLTLPKPRTRISDNRATSIGKTTDQERIRNNQRRCRARRKEYIASLEDKIREHEGVGVEHTTNKKLEELATENKLLKRLLQSLGLREEFIKAYGNAVRITSDMPCPPLGNEYCAQANEPLSSFPALDILQSQLLQVAAREDEADHIASVDPTQLDVPLSWGLLDVPAASTAASESIEAGVHFEHFGQLTMDALMTKAFSNAVTVDDVSDTTTLCSWAFSLILKNNLKGYSAADLDLKLRAGYRHGATPTEGCRVDNKVLLNVLAEVT